MTSPKRYAHTNGSSGTIKYQARPSISPVSPSATLRRNFVRRPGDSGLENIPEGGLNGKGRQVDTDSGDRKENRRPWKTLRDFVDDQAIDNILEAIESDRSILDVRLAFSNQVLPGLIRHREFSARQTTTQKL